LSLPSSLASRSWFANAANGIGDFFARVGNFGRVNTDELCVGATCVTEDQFKSLLNGGAAAGATTEGGASGAPGGSSALGDQLADDTILPDNDDDPATVATSTLDAVSANDTEPVIETAANTLLVEEVPELEPEASNDNEVPDPLPATGTAGIQYP
jgi:hypothetical protein